MSTPAPSEPTASPSASRREQRERVDQLLRTHDVVGVALAGGHSTPRMMPATRVSSRRWRAHAPRERQRAERGGRERLAGAREHQQAMARKSIGQDAGRSADEEERERAHSERHAARNGELVSSSAASRPRRLAHRPHGVQDMELPRQRKSEGGGARVDDGHSLGRRARSSSHSPVLSSAGEHAAAVGYTRARWRRREARRLA